MTVRVELRRDARIGPLTGPWIRRKQLARIHGSPDPHAIAQVSDRRGNTVGWGLISPVSGITVRLLTFGDEPPAEDWLQQRLAASFDARTAYDFRARATTGYREVNSEGDGLPGLVIDRYDTDLVVQITTAPMAARQDAIVEWLQRNVEGALHIVRPEASAKYEGIDAELARDHEAPMLRFAERGLEFEVPAPPSQKTGAYFDQRSNRIAVARLAKRHGGPMLDVGCHVGGFALHAARVGVEVVGLDQSKSALALAQRNAEVSGIDGVQWVEADMFARFEDPRLEGPFGTIVLDPPKMASRKSDVDRAFTALTRLVSAAMRRLDNRGHLVVCSCSHHLGRDHLDRVVAQARGRFARVQTLGPGPDHPVMPGHREGEYLRVNIYQRRD